MKKNRSLIIIIFITILTIGTAILFINLSKEFMEKETINYRNDSISIILSSISFDPLIELPSENPDEYLSFLSENKVSDLIIEEDLRGNDYDLYLVQFDGPIEGEWVSAMVDLDVKIFSFVHEHAYLVQMDESIVSQVEILPHVRWVGLYQPAYKILSDQAYLLDSEDEVIFNIYYFDNIVDKAKLIDDLENLGCVIITDYRNIIRVQCRGILLGDILKFKEVINVELYVEPKISNDIAVDIMNIDPEIWTTHGLDGTGQIIGIADTGLDTGYVTDFDDDGDWEDGNNGIDDNGDGNIDERNDDLNNNGIPDAGDDHVDEDIIDDDGDGRADEDPDDGVDNDGDGLIDEDTGLAVEINHGGEGTISDDNDGDGRADEDDSNHPDFAGKILNIHSFPIQPAWTAFVNNPGADDGAGDLESGHGTHVSGSILGDGTSSGGTIRGSAHGADLIFQALEQFVDVTTPSPGFNDGYKLAGIPDDLNFLFQQAYDDGARIHSNSWGSSRYGVYNDNCEELDEFVWMNKDMTILFSASNDGNDGDDDHDDSAATRTGGHGALGRASDGDHGG